MNNKVNIYGESMTGKSSTENPLETQHTRVVLRSAILSRLILISLIILWRFLLSPYDTSASINPNCLTSTSANYSPPTRAIIFPRFAFVIEDSIVWDSVYFVRIAQCGYEYEQSYAFLPLLPICISLLSQTVFAPLIPLIGHRAVLGLSGYVLNNVAFLFAAVFLYRLSVIILKDPELALRAAILFCFNPASIFYSSIYSESLYSLLSIGGLYYLMSGANNFATLWLALSGSARSNGVLNAGYICFQTMHRAYDAVFLKKHAYLAVQVLIAGALRCLCIFVPFIAFQAYGYYNMCLGRFPDEMRPWCNARLPVLYNFIQSHYWGVGFLRYFQLKQLPNFLLASPVLSLALCSIIHYVKLRPEIFFSLGFRASDEDKNSSAVLISMGADTKLNSASSLEILSSKVQREDQVLRQRKRSINGENTVSLQVENESPEKHGYLSVTVLPFVLHLGFMAATTFFVMHVQVATRFLSASPPFYWFASYIMVSPSVGKMQDGSNGNVANDSYHRYKEDVAIIKKIGLNAYRISISWPRVLPSERLSGGVNKEGINYYNNVINELLANGIEPYVTFFHWDLPKALQDEYGGFLSSQIVVDFCNYAELCFWEFGDRVKHWVTFNESWSYNVLGYVNGTLATGRGASSSESIRSLPAIHRCSTQLQKHFANGDPGREPYLVAHNQLLSHATAVQLYRQKLQIYQNGNIEITLVTTWFEPLSETSDNDKKAAERAQDFKFGLFMDPLTAGDYPSSMRANVGSRLPKFNQEQSELLKGSFDFIGLNYYTANYATDAPNPNNENLSYNTDSHVELLTERNGVSIGSNVNP
ncbi:hypothetical protein F0562_001345 [Nyssa sinensis]|uniref:GPI mannosyltransferase 2 n=1 Tax=Nyssa sinensis TaxID=561372 RepID=A0A5J5C6X5_9ASTE|nr:hypothetical protein F0562_001345 [Nyssa sinensis]